MPAQKGSCSHQLHPRTHNQMGLLKISSNQYVNRFTRRYQRKKIQKRSSILSCTNIERHHTAPQKSPRLRCYLAGGLKPNCHGSTQQRRLRNKSILGSCMTKGNCCRKKYFDHKHCAKPKVLHPGNQVLLKQTKTTTKPPFNPALFIVTEVEGNQVTITDGDIVKKRDKNKLKVLPKRKALGHQSDKVVS